MKIEFFSKETGELVEFQDDFIVNADGIVSEEIYDESSPYAAYYQNDLIGWRIVNE